MELGGGDSARGNVGDQVVSAFESEVHALLSALTGHVMGQKSVHSTRHMAARVRIVR